jgi:AraC-like DNA-binding protein
MVEYQITYPRNPILTPYIEHYSRVTVNSVGIHTKKLFPRPGAAWIFTDQPFEIDNKKFYSNCLMGITDKASTFSWNNNTLEGLSVKFTSIGLSRFVDIPTSQIKNKVINFQKVCNSVDDSIPAIIEASSWKEKINQIEHFLLKSLSTINALENRIFQLAKHIKNHPTSDANTLKRDIPLSTRQFERKFKELTGINLQTYTRLCRFNVAKNQLLHSSEHKLTHIGYNAGYFDQPHFSREFKRFSLQAPTNFIESYPFYKKIATAH